MHSGLLGLKPIAQILSWPLMRMFSVFGHTSRLVYVASLLRLHISGTTMIGLSLQSRALHLGFMINSRSLNIDALPY